MNKNIVTFLFLLFTVLLLQGCGVNARIKKADKKFQIGEYYAAGDIYRSVYSRVSPKDKEMRAHVAFHHGECFRLLNYSRAEQAYLNAIRNNYADSIVYIRYAQMLARNGKYDEAIKYFAQYNRLDSLGQLALNGKKVIELIEQYKQEPTKYVVKKADFLNVRRASTFSPAFANAESDMLMFTSTRNMNKKAAAKNSAITGLPNNNIYFLRKNAAGKWESPEMIASEVNTPTTDDGVCSFSPDGRTMYFTRARQTGQSETGTEIFQSSRAGGEWSEPVKIEFFADTTISVAHPAIAPDGVTIYFVSDAPKGYGGKDIWKGKLEDGKCKYIENLGPQINTIGDEMFPVMRADGTLYFSSNGHPGFGGLDIFKAVQLKNDESWIVTNMGTPMNSNADDFGLAFEGVGEKGFFSTTRGDSRGNDNIWSFELPAQEYVIEGKVVDEQSNPISDAVVRLVSNTGLNARIQTKKDGTFRIKVDKDMECVMLATARGYLNRESKISTMGIRESQIFNVDFQLPAIYKPVQLNNIFYEFAKWELRPESEEGLQVLVKLLKDNPNIVIEIGAHTDYVGNNAANKLLSERRAKSVVDYLIATGIEAARLSPVGYGEEQPFTVDVSTARKHSFLKEGDILDEVFVTKLAPEQQEIANQINRRTEFRVLRTTYR